MTFKKFEKTDPYKLRLYKIVIIKNRLLEVFVWGGL